MIHFFPNQKERKNDYEIPLLKNYNLVNRIYFRILFYLSAL